MPLAYLIAGLGCLCLASVIARFTRRTASAGGLYSYIAEGLGPRAGFIGGWLYAGGFAIGVLVRARDRELLLVGGAQRPHRDRRRLVHVVLPAARARDGAGAARHPRLDPPAARGHGGRRAGDPRAGGRDRRPGRRRRADRRAARPRERPVDLGAVPRRRARLHRLHRLRGRGRARRGGARPAARDHARRPHHRADRARLLRVRHLGDGDRLRRRQRRRVGEGPGRARHARGRATSATGSPR